MNGHQLTMKNMKSNLQIFRKITTGTKKSQFPNKNTVTNIVSHLLKLSILHRSNTQTSSTFPKNNIGMNGTQSCLLIFSQRLIMTQQLIDFYFIVILFLICH